METKIKSSELFIKLVVNSQYAMASEDSNIIQRMAENHHKMDDFLQSILKDITMNNEYMRMSMVKTAVITLEELGIVEKDVDLLNTEISNDLVAKAMQIYTEQQNNKN